MIQLWYTIRFSIRMLAARPIMTTLAVLTMGIGIGVTTSQLMIYQGLLYPRLPLPNADQIVAVNTTYEGDRTKFEHTHSHLFNYWKNHQTSFDSLFSYSEGTVNVFYQNRAIRYSGSFVDSGFIDGLGVKPFLGEGFIEGDDQLEMPKKAVLGFEAWEQDFGSDPSIIGKEILVNGESAMVVGVMPKGLKFPFTSSIWVPDVFYPGQLVAYDINSAAFVAGRIKDGISYEEAESELNRMSGEFFSQIPEDFREVFEGTGIKLVPYVESVTDHQTRNILYLSSTVVLLVLLIACANVTNLLLAGFSVRMKEMAVRCALGASRRDIAFQLWFESFMISAAGALVGIIYCLWATDWGNQQLMNMEAPFWYHLSFTPTLLLMIGVITLLSSFLAALLPMLKVNRLSINQVLQDDSRTGSSLSIGVTNKTLVVLQISISCALLIVAGMMIKQIYSIRAVDMGFDTKSVITARLGLMEGKYKSSISRRQFTKNLLRSLNEQSEIEAASISTRMQLLQPNWSIGVKLEDKNGAFSGDTIKVYSEGISNQFFECLDVDLLEGRLFDTKKINMSGLAEVIVTEQFANTFFKRKSPLGKKLLSVQEMGSNTITEEFEIVGVVGNSFARGGFSENSDMGGVHFHYTSMPTRFQTIVLKPADGFNPYSLVPLLKRTVADIDKEIPLYFVETPYDSIENEFAGLRFAADLFVIFSAVALFLSFVGIFGITTFSILERIQEIGIRKSIGATGTEVFVMVFRKGGVELIVGLILGTLAGISLTFALNSIFLKTGIVDPVVYLVVVMILTGSSLIATVYPARKASLIQPAEATRVN